jgi:hypothetical protein
MNIYEVVDGCEEELPNGRTRKWFASAVVQQKDEYWVYRKLQGPRPASEPWRTLELKLDKPRLPHADFPGFDYSALVCGERAMAAVGNVLRETGELFPVTLRGAKGAHQLYRIPARKTGLLDAAKTTWWDVAGEKCLLVPAFRGDRIGPKLKLFKIPEDHGIGTYCVERTGKANDGEFKALVEKHGLTGLRFNRVWTDGRGPAGKKSPRVGNEAQQSTDPATSDRPLDEGERRDIRLSIARGYKHLKLAPKSSTASTQRAIRSAVDAIVLGRNKPRQNAVTDLAVNLGCLWGQTVCDELKWEWCRVKFADGREAYAIVPPDRSHMVLPMDFIHRQLRKRPPEENTSMLLFNMLKGKKFGRAKPRSYVHAG